MIITLTIQLLTANINWRVSVKYRQMLEAEATTNYHYYKAIEQIAQLNCTMYIHILIWSHEMKSFFFMSVFICLIAGLRSSLISLLHRLFFCRD